MSSEQRSRLLPGLLDLCLRRLVPGACACSPRSAVRAGVCAVQSAAPRWCPSTPQLLPLPMPVFQSSHSPVCFLLSPPPAVAEEWRHEARGAEGQELVWVGCDQLMDFADK